jgi:hypothetical protein
MLSQLSRLAIHSPIPTVVARRALLPCATVLPSRLAVLARRLTSKSGPTNENVVILGAGGRDFFDFMTYWSKKPEFDVKCFTGAQIPGIDRRIFPKEMCNNDKNDNKYPHGIEIFPEHSLEALLSLFNADTVALAYSDLSYDTVQSLAARANAAGCKFIQLPAKLTQIESTKPVISVCASRTGVGKSQTTRYIAKYFKDKGLKVAVVRHPMVRELFVTSAAPLILNMIYMLSHEHLFDATLVFLVRQQIALRLQLEQPEMPTL